MLQVCFHLQRNIACLFSSILPLSYCVSRLFRTRAYIPQREVPEHVNMDVAKIASEANVPVIFDMGGEDSPLPDELLPFLSFVCPNETELERLVGLPTKTNEEVFMLPLYVSKNVLFLLFLLRSCFFTQMWIEFTICIYILVYNTTHTQVEIAARALQKKGVTNVLTTLGAEGSVLLRGDDAPVWQPSYKVDKVVDTTGAGDCFRAAFTMAFVEGMESKEAMAFGAAAAAICVTRMGAQPSMPLRAEVEEFLKTQGAKM